MKIEICIEGPRQALAELYQNLQGLSPSWEETFEDVTRKEQNARILLFESEKELDNRLLEISRIAQKLEKDLRLEKGFDFRLRNLAYAEPPGGGEGPKEPFKPISSMTIQPWRYPVVRVTDPRTILIDAHHAFGTGRHPTTRLCLEALDHMARGDASSWGLQGRAVLDFGCGSGLLAIAAVKMGAENALGVEIDKPSAETARKNVALNKLSEKIEIREGSWEVVRGKYDLILANLVASVLLRTGRHIPDHLQDEGRAVISGFGLNQVDEMERFFSSLGLVTAGRSSLDGWGSVVMIKTKA